MGAPGWSRPAAGDSAWPRAPGPSLRPASSVAARQRALDAELARVPDEQPLRDAHAAATAAATDLVQREERVTAQEAAVAVATAAARTAGEDRDQAAADLSLPTTLDALQEVR